LGGKTLGRKVTVLIGRLRTPRPAGPGHRTADVESDSGARPSRARRRETSLTGGRRLSARAGEERREERAVLGRGAQLGPEERCGGWGESWAARGRKEKGVGLAGPRGEVKEREEREKEKWAGPKERKRGREKEMQFKCF
jgi:hypothetical protein